IPSVRVGGPYTITVSFIGYNNFEVKDVNLQLGETYSINAKMTDSSVALEDVVVVADKNAVIDKKRTGSAINISSKTIKEMPTISRSQADLTRLTPSSDGNSFGGRNNQFNNFSLDGSIFNNPFGLDAATPGGQSNAQPISLDAIEQVQVSLAPYDVTQAGFTGAAVNAVTKSGTNEFKGTVYGFYRNQDMTGNKVSGQEIDRADLNQMQTGFSIGGPLIENKLFFFANFEIERRNDLGSPYKARRAGDEVGGNISRVSYDDMIRVQDALSSMKDSSGNVYSYDPGKFEGYMHETSNEKGIVKIDWNINEQHTLSAKYNFLRARRDLNAHPEAIGRRGPDLITLQFENAGYRINNNIDSWIVELNSRFENSSNKLLAGYTKFDDWRDPFSTPFPTININQAGIRGIVAGHEPFSIHNVLDQQVLQITDNFNYYLGNHVITAGASFEKFMFNNSFNLGVYEGTFGPGWNNVDSFVNATQDGSFYHNQVETAQATYDAADWSWAKTNVGQAAVYIQDKWNVNDKFTLTYGIRMDMPLYFDTAEMLQEKAYTWNTTDSIGTVVGEMTYYDDEGNLTKIDNTKFPKQTPLISPRVGFNYDIKGDKTLQLRGGSGLFTGRLPFVWIGNQVQNYNDFYFNSTAPDFKFPQVWRSNLGFDANIGNGFIIETDLIYTKDLAAPVVKNYALGTPSQNLNVTGYGDNRPVYLPADRIHAFDYFKSLYWTGPPFSPTNAYVFDNVDGGYTFNASIQVKKSFKNGLFTSLGYNYLDAKDYSSIAAEITGDAYDRNPHHGNANQLELAPSMYGNKHRFVFVAGKTFNWSEKWVTTMSLIGEASQGGRFNYTYSGDINFDHSPLNDLIYIPKDNSEIAAMNFVDYDDYLGNTVLASEQRAAFEAFIQQDDYLSENRGNYAEKYAILSPWYSKFDFRFMQDFNFKVGNKTNTIQFTMDIMNIGNMFNSNWGVRKLPVNTQPIGVDYERNDWGDVINHKDPMFTFDVEQKSTFVDDFSLMSRW
ncbi:MAG: TonB-dependent receptor, partial [Bacteroidota bacterium]